MGASWQVGVSDSIMSWGGLTRNARIVISFVIRLYIRYNSDGVLYRLLLGKMTRASTLSFLAAISVALVLGCERP